MTCSVCDGTGETLCPECADECTRTGLPVYAWAALKARRIEREACAGIARARAVQASEVRARCVEMGLPHSYDVRYHEAWSIEQHILARGDV